MAGHGRGVGRALGEPRRWQRALCCRGAWAGGQLGPRVPGAPSQHAQVVTRSQAPPCPAVCPPAPVPRAPKHGLRWGRGRLDPEEVTPGCLCGASWLGKPTPIPTQPSGGPCEAQTRAGVWAVLFRSDKPEPFGELLTLKAEQVMEINGV